MGGLARSLILVVFLAVFIAFSCGTLSSAFVGSIVYALAKNVSRILGLTVIFGSSFDPVGDSMRNWILYDTDPNVKDYNPNIPYANYDPFWWEDPPDDLYVDEDGFVSPNPQRGVPAPSRRRWAEAAIADWVRAQGGRIVRRFNMNTLGITSYFGVFRSDGWHSGVDFSMPVGTPIRSLHGGYAQVIHVGWMGNGYGNYVVLSDGYNIILYAHLQSINVKQGDIVDSGAVIGLSGSTGRSSGPHLHLEFMDAKNGVRFYDPCSVMECPGPRRY